MGFVLGPAAIHPVLLLELDMIEVDLMKQLEKVPGLHNLAGLRLIFKSSDPSVVIRQCLLLMCCSPVNTKLSVRPSILLPINIHCRVIGFFSSFGILFPDVRKMIAMAYFTFWRNADLECALALLRAWPRICYPNTVVSFIFSSTSTSYVVLA